MSELQHCCHEGCENKLPQDESKVPPGWSIIHVQEYTSTSIRSYYLYLCPNETLATVPKQGDLFEASIIDAPSEHDEPSAVPAPEEAEPA